MASQSSRSLRTAPVARISFNLRRFQLSLASALGVDIVEPGIPGGGGVAVLSGDERQALNSYLFQEMLSKYDDGSANAQKAVLTWEKFHEAERLCARSNWYFAKEDYIGPYVRETNLARKLIAKILGRFSWDAAATGFGWGPGASTRQPRRKSDAAYKFSGNPETTAGNAILADAAISYIPSWKRELTPLGEEGVGYCKIVPGNRIVTVPKNYKVDRTIAIEPCMNMYIQKGIGALMRKRLHLAGCNLDDQTRNQRLAQVGSLCGSLATIDLSMASDTISRELVNLLLPPDWVSAIEQSRSPFGVLPSGEKIFYQKISSMGNGFTFELESMIFYALALAYCHTHGIEVSRVSVYGDDIILPSEAADGFSGLLRDAGFTVNTKKSYWRGPFRESCGKHYFNGYEITPFYVRRRVNTLPELFLLHNNLYRWLARNERLLGVETSESVRGVLHSIRLCAPARWRKPRIPDGFGDGAFIGPMDQCNLRLHPDGWEVYIATVLLQSTEVEFVEISGLLPKGLQCVYRRPRDRISGWLPIDKKPIEVHPSKGGRYREIKILIPRCAMQG